MYTELKNIQSIRQATTTPSRCEVLGKSDFSYIRYAQSWEDADILLEGLKIQPDHVCLSIASAGDNTLAMLSQNPARVIALDLNPAQLACLELRVAAYKNLSHPELLALIGSRPGRERLVLYRRCRSDLSEPVRRFWDARPDDIEAGIGSAGKFERYFALFRRWVLTLTHHPSQVRQLLQGGPAEQRRLCYEQGWNNWRWRLLFRVFFSEFVMARLGRDPRFFDYIEGDLAGHLHGRVEHALLTLNPADNPYLQWILTGRHLTALPFALRPENFERIQVNLDRLEWHALSAEDFLTARPDLRFDRFNLSDIFEYMSLENYYDLLKKLVGASRPGARLAYWNMLAPRQRPETMAGQLRALSGQAQALHARDKAFFYSQFVLEEVI